MTIAPKGDVLRKATAKLAIYAAATLVAVCTYRLLMVGLRGDVASLAEISNGIISGHPLSIANQNRLLSPYAILMISSLGMSYETAWRLFIAILVLLQSLLVAEILLRESRSGTKAIVGLVVFMFLFLLLPNRLFLSWDGIDIVVFTLFAYAVLNRFGIIFYSALFFVEIFNRESALYISAYLILDAFHLSIAPFSIKLKDKSKTLLGVTLCSLGAGYTKLIREALFVQPTSKGTDEAHRALGNHTEYLLFNLQSLFLPNLTDTSWIFSVIVFGAVVFFWSKIYTFRDEELKCFAMYLVLLLGILVFGVFSETRILIILLPFGYLLSFRLVVQNPGGPEVRPG